jgi:hypothetical protein
VEQTAGNAQTARGTVEAAGFFAVQANWHKKEAKKYYVYLQFSLVVTFIITVVLGVLTLRVKLPSDLKNQFALSVLYLNILAVLWFINRFYSRNFRVNEHLKVLNQTKEMILTAGEKFALSPVGKEVSGRILDVVIGSTFTVGETGHLPKDSEGSISDLSTILTLAKSMGSRP